MQTIELRVTDADRKQLQDIASGPDVPAARRAGIVLMASEGLGNPSVAAAHGVSERSVRTTLKRFRGGGPDALVSRVSPGRPRSVPEEQRELLTSLILRSPREFGIDSEGWGIADLIVVARRELPLSGLSHWTLRREILRIVASCPDLRDRLNLPDQKRPGAPVGNHNATRHGAYSERKPSAAEVALLADVEARLLDDFPDAHADDTELTRAAARACLMLNRALDSDSADAAMRLDGRLRKTIRALRAKKQRDDKPATTPADWAANLLKHL